MIIRKAKSSDIDGVYEVFLELAKVEDNSASEIAPFVRAIRKRRKSFEKDIKKELLKSVRENKSIYLIAELNNEVVGYAYGSFDDSKNEFFDAPATGIANALVVKGKYQGKGIALKLAKERDVWFKKKGCKVVYLEVYPTNSAVEFHKKLGYKTVTLKMCRKL
jgi:GNAT superfamily N-acetyltransferase